MVVGRAAGGAETRTTRGSNSLRYVTGRQDYIGRLRPRTRATYNRAAVHLLHVRVSHVAVLRVSTVSSAMRISLVRTPCVFTCHPSCAACCRRSLCRSEMFHAAELCFSGTTKTLRPSYNIHTAFHLPASPISTELLIGRCGSRGERRVNERGCAGSSCDELA